MSGSEKMYKYKQCLEHETEIHNLHFLQATTTNDVILILILKLGIWTEAVQWGSAQALSWAEVDKNLSL